MSNRIYAAAGTLLALMALAFVANTAQAQDPTVVDSTESESSATANCASTARLSRLRAWSGDLAADAPACLEIELEQGAFVRIALAIDSGLVDFSLLEPGAPEPRLVIAWGGLRPPRQLSWTAEVGGVHTVSLAGLQLSEALVVARGIRATVMELESPASRARREQQLRSDPRVGWLRDHAIRLRSIDPDDNDFTDLEVLRHTLGDVRVVHLGVSGLGSGAHFLANGRVARFLLEELGFDALIFESGIYDLWRTERALREGRPAREAFQLGLWPFLADSKQLAPLSNYLAERIRGNRPISIAGFDFQFTSGSGAATFGTDLGEFLRQLDVSTPLSDADSPEGQLLRRWLESRLESGTPPPSPPELARLQEALTETAHRVEAVATKDERLWSQMLRSTAAFVEGFDGREEQMSDNLTWLVEEHFQDRRVVVFGTNYHMIRDRALLPHEYWAGPWPFTTGERLAEVLGSAVYQIGATSYEGSTRSASPFGRRNDIQADLSPYPEFEEWMAATGIDYGIVDLRGAAARGEWAGGIFVARPLGHVPMRSTWSRHLDAILFVREQRPSEQVERPAG